MRNKHLGTLRQIFENPVRSDIRWSDVESLLKALGADIIEGSGSRVNISLNGRAAVFHRPLPQKVTEKGAVKSLRNFLTSAGIRP